MPRIAELAAPQLARHATNTFVYWGRQEVGTRLAYHALALDPTESEALTRLSDMLDIDGSQPFSAVVLEHACSAAANLPPDARERLEHHRLIAVWTWGFARHESGQTELAADAFDDRSQFEIDAEGYGEFIGAVVGRAGSLPAAFRVAHAFAGVLAGLLSHRELGDRATFEDVYHPEQFAPTPAYEAWLTSGTDELDALERQRAAATGDNS